MYVFHIIPRYITLDLSGSGGATCIKTASCDKNIPISMDVVYGYLMKLKRGGIAKID